MNLTKLNNINPFEVNNSLINESSEIIPNIVSNTNDMTGGYFGLGMMIIIFTVLLIILMADQEVFRLKFSNALAGSLGITVLVGVVMFSTDIITEFQHLMWFAIPFAISLVVVYYDQS